MLLWIDLETRSPIAIRRGTYLYAEHCEPIMWNWGIDDGEPVVEEGHTPSADLLLAAYDADEVWAHEAKFDRVVINRCAPALADLLPLRKWRCTAALARMHGCPGGLDKLCAIFKIPHTEAKVAGGKNLIQLFCKPNRKGAFNDKHSHPAEWAEFLRYGRNDITSMRAVKRKLPHWNANAHRWDLWHLNQTINDVGMNADRALATAIVAETTEARGRLNVVTADIAQFVGNREDIHSATQVQKLRELCAEQGVKLPDLKADTVERVLEDERLPASVRILLTARQEVAKSSTAKAKRLLDCVTSDGRMHGLLLFAGAQRTGRTAGSLFNPLNMPRPAHDQADIDQAINYFLTGGIDLWDPDHVMSWGADCLRGLLVASPGRKLLSADWSAIEGRDTCWFAGEDWELEAYRLNDIGQGPKPYAVTAGRTFGMDPADVDKKSFEYLIGKVQTLALGYQGAVGAFISMIDAYGLRLEELTLKARPLLSRELWSEAEAAYWHSKFKFGLPQETWMCCWCLVQLWRRSHPAIVQFWWDIQGAVVQTLIYGGEYTVGRVKVMRKENWVLIQLPSGRCLCYPGMRIEGDGSLTFWGVDQFTKQWCRITTYGGKLTENCAQAIAVDLHDECLLEAQQAGLNPVLSVYDEINCDATMDRSIKELEAIMVKPRPWTTGLPLATEGWEGPRYHK